MEGYDNVVSLEYRVSQAFLGRYFMGHTPQLILPPCGSVWAALYNPPASGVNVFVNTFTVSNFSTTPFRAQLWLNAMAGGGEVSPFACPTNTAFVPLTWPMALIDYGQGALQGGCSLFTRVAGAQSTEVGNYYGKIVVPPGGTFLAQLTSPSPSAIQTEVAFGWWEEPVKAQAQSYIEAASKEGK
jgi:hypothetical protein